MSRIEYIRGANSSVKYTNYRNALTGLLHQSLNLTSILDSFRRTLEEYCARQYGWLSTFARDAVKEFDRFIQVKMSVKDYDGRLLSPSPILDQVWHPAVLHTAEYAEMCGEHFIHHRPQGALPGEDMDRERRRERTIEHFVAMFGEIPEDRKRIWQSDGRDLACSWAHR